MKDRDEIKELFQKELGNYQATVNPNLWNGIQAGIGATGTTGAVSAMALSTKIIIAASVSAVIAVGVTLYSITGDKKTENQITEQKELLVQEEDTQEKEISKEENTNSEEISTKETPFVKESKRIEEGETSEGIEKESQSVLEKTNTSVLKSEETKGEPTSTPPTRGNDSKNIERSSPEVSKNSPSVVDEVKKKEEIDLSKVEIGFVKEENQIVKFYAKNVPGEAEVIWNFGDGSFDYDVESQHYYFESGEYKVSLQVQIEGKTKTVTELINIKIKGEIGELPNVFTPNGDGHNDELFIETKYLKTFQLTVMDSHQNVVYTTQDPNFRWNGIDNYGRPVKEGNYIYVIMAEDEAGNTVNKYQQLTIQR